MESPPITDPGPKIWVVLGSKRGGTSYLAKLLGDDGVKFDICGNGHNEDIDFVQLNNMLLEAAGGDWNNLPPDDALAAAVAQNQDRLLGVINAKKEAAEGAPWGWKDPRQSATFKHFLPFLIQNGDEDIYLICVFRRPIKAAQSMHRTWPQHSLDFCLGVINDYYRRAIGAIQEFVNYDL